MKTYIFNRYCNTVQTITIKAKNLKAAKERVGQGDGWESKEEVLECWDELNKEKTIDSNKHQP